MVCFLALLPPAAQSMSCLPSSAPFATKAALWAPTPFFHVVESLLPDRLQLESRHLRANHDLSLDHYLNEISATAATMRIKYPRAGPDSSTSHRSANSPFPSRPNNSSNRSSSSGTPHPPAAAPSKPSLNLQNGHLAPEEKERRRTLGLCMFCGEKAIALIDTGASRSVSSSTFAEKHHLPLGPPEAIPCLYSVNNTPVPIKGLTTPLRIVVSNLSVDHPLLILPNASHDIIIGCDLLKAHRASIDVATDKVHFHGLPPVSSNPSVDEVLASASATAPAELPVPAPKVQLPSEYQDFSDLFDKKSAETLPPHRRGFDLEIKLKDESSLRAAPLGPELKDQSTFLPALPAEIADIIMDEAQHWQGVQHTKRDPYEDRPVKVTVPQSIHGNSTRVKAIQVVRDTKNLYYRIGDNVFDLIVRDEQGAVQYEYAAKATFVNSTLVSATLWPASTPIIRQIRVGWQVQVQPSESARDVLFESLVVRCL
ncbi:hypothetical protein CAOG_010019 [Capsaspora owczarzaki ATCC 30864]|uniref:Peptidase A2 domain-containing protein n=1 Tax=Capsaspora owczarzaki (strain ATCC 30864) TaxID=595528 RepID=A0A0D2X4P7_CAPO3|nr:hypothetical protein CAOG_010019 [Capsaspora owczarzaki ATCC 30864]